MSSAVNSKIPTAAASMASGWPGITTFGLIAVIMYIWSFVSISQFTGSKDDWNLIKPQITKVWILSLIGTFALAMASLFFFIQDPQKTMYFMLVVSCLSLGLAYSALAVAAISR